MRTAACCILLLVVSIPLHAQNAALYPAVERYDTATVEMILKEATENSRVMEILSDLTEVYGPRLSWSPEFRKAAHWVLHKMKEFGLQDAHLESWTPIGRGWSLKRHSAHVVEPVIFPVISFPRAWSPGTKGTVTREVVLFDPRSDSAAESYRGKLRGKFVLMGGARELKARFTPLATRETAEQLLELMNTDAGPRTRRRLEDYPAMRERALLEYRKMQICYEEGAAALLMLSRGDGGTVFVQGTTTLSHPDVPREERERSWQVPAPKLLPQVEVAAEHFNRMARLLEKGMTVKMEMQIAVEISGPDSGYNVIAEIPGTDLRDEVVMIGAHLDSWHGGTGTTDNGTGVATCLEAMRVLKALDLKPRRTIRIALWGGEEQGLFGSRAHVKRHFAEKVTEPGDSVGRIVLKPAGEKFSAYFNNDNGTGKVRGVYLQGNEALRPIFRSWLEPFGPDARTLTLRSTSSTDHMAFDERGLPGFQFIQDDIEYFTRTWHSTMDVYDRAQKDDLIQTATALAVFAYNAAMRDERLPRKPAQP